MIVTNVGAVAYQGDPNGAFGILWQDQRAVNEGDDQRVHGIYARTKQEVLDSLNTLVEAVKSA